MSDCMRTYAGATHIEAGLYTCAAESVAAHSWKFLQETHAPAWGSVGNEISHTLQMRQWGLSQDTAHQRHLLA